MPFSHEQSHAYQLFLQGHNIFITGPGGSGKSHLIREFVKEANRTFRNIYVAALTGFAALLLNCDARTLHSCTGIGLGNKDVPDLIKQIRMNRRALSFWKTSQIFIVDEVSMLSVSLFQKLNAIGQILRKNDKPFGGIQVIFSGDFYQLPPIGNKHDLSTRQFCFMCDEWDQVFARKHQIQLVTIFRQTDTEYADILNQLRVGIIKKSSVRKLNTRLWSNILKKSPTEYEHVCPTQIFPIRSMVDNINTSKLNDLTSTPHTYTMDRLINLPVSENKKKLQDRVTNVDIQRELDYLTTNLTCEESIILKEGARVMLIINIVSPKGDNSLELCNGSQGIITQITNDYPIVKFDNGIIRPILPYTWPSEKIPWVGISQIPLLLSWAITIHKSQGLTLDIGDVDVGNRVFSNGQTYVALSRIKSLDGLYLKSLDISKITINADAQQYYKKLETAALVRSEKKRNSDSKDAEISDTPQVVLAANADIPVSETSVCAPSFDQYTC